MCYEKRKALLVEQPFGDFYIISIPASKLVNLVHSIPAEYTDGQLDGVQRAINKKRIDNISRFCQTESPLFPNTIILAANIMENGDLVEEENKWFFSDGFIFIPRCFKAASIVDGQHRIEGIKKALDEGADDFDLVCAVYMDLPTSEQAEVFATINFNQQKVDKSLAYQLFGYDLDSTEPKYWTPDTLAVHITRILGKQASSPFRNHIGYGVRDSDIYCEEYENRDDVLKGLREDPWKVSTSTMVGGITKLISKDSIRDRYDLHKKRMFKKDRAVLDIGKPPVPPLRELYLGFKDKSIYSIVENFFLSVRGKLWVGQHDTILKKTIGIQALFDVLYHILNNDDLDFSKDVGIEYFDSILNNVDVHLVEEMDNNYSGSGRTMIRNLLLEQIGG